jgi:hypothetical protein
LLRSIYSPFSHPHSPHAVSFCPPLHRTGTSPIFISIRSPLLLLVHYVHSHLASRFTFLLLTTFRQLGWRLKQLAALKHLNKPRCRPLVGAAPCAQCLCLHDGTLIVLADAFVVSMLFCGFLVVTLLCSLRAQEPLFVGL